MAHNRLLVADRNENFLTKTAEILAAAKVEMIPVTNGARVLTLCRHEQPDAILLHADLAGMPGTEVCHRVKTQLDPLLPVVLMFPDDQAHNGELALRCLADNFLVRPLKRTELLCCVRFLLTLRNHLRDRPAAGAAILAAHHQGMVSLEVFHIFLRLEVQRVERYGFPLAVLDVGLDELPGEAEAWGRSLENQLGPALAEAMRGALRDIDLSTVISPRQMLVVMPHTDAAGGRIAAERICQTVAAQSYHFGRTRIQPTISIGLACLHGEAATPQELLGRAQVLRSRAAAAGGNRVAA